MAGTGTWAIALVMLVPAVVRGAFETRPAGARSASMGVLCSAGGTDGWGGIHNPALMIRSGSVTAGASVTTGIFGIPELGAFDAMAIVPAGPARLGLSCSRLGNDLYRESEIGLSLAAGVRKDAAAGASLRIFHLSIAGYGAAAAAGLDLGLALNPTPQVSVALTLTNCTGSSIGACREEIPRSVTAAVEWNPEPVCIVIEIAKEEGALMSVAAGCECRLAGILRIRGGCTTDFPGASAGAGIEWLPLRLDYAWRWHATLGGTHTVSLTVEGLL